MDVAPSVPRIKFCGITNLADAEQALEHGAWALGLNFWNRSRRRCKLGVATEIAAASHRRAEIAGVFVNATLDELSRTAESVGLNMLQLHGDEGPAFCAEAARRTGCQVIKAVRIRSGAEIQALASFHTDFHLLDSYVPDEPGGTGETFAWDLARQHEGPTRLILSGGLTPDNVATAIATVNPFAVDVATGVELVPGRKDPSKLAAFAAAVRGAAEVSAA